MLDREGHPRPWRDLVRVYRRLEARGELRGGRFVEGFAGEQFALPEAVSALRKRRRQGLDGSVLALSAADPLNLTGIVLPQDRVATIASHRLLFRDGLVLAAAEAGKVRFFEEVDASQRWELERQLTQRRVDRRVRAYLGSAG